MMNSQTILPNARKENLVVMEFPKELLVYDLIENKAFCLNQTARLVLDECDGQKTFEQAKISLETKLNSPIDEQILWLAISQLKKYGLLDEGIRLPDFPKFSRRDLMRIGTAVSVSLPFISLVIAPSSIYAQSCLNPLTPCVVGDFCCPVPGQGIGICQINDAVNRCNCGAGDDPCISGVGCCPGFACSSACNCCIRL